MGPREFREQIVIPNIEELRADYGDLRRAFNAVAALDALAAQVYVWCVANAPNAVVGIRDDSLYRERLAQQDEAFRLLRDIAKAQKHVHLTRGTPQVTKASQVEPQRLGYDQARYDEGRYDSPSQVVVTTDAGEVRVVEALVQRALDLLDQEIAQLGIP